MPTPKPSGQPTLDELLDLYAKSQVESDTPPLQRLLDRLIDIGPDLAIALVVSLAIAALLWFAHRRTKKYYATRANLEFRRQLVMLGLTVLAVLLAIVLIPMPNDLRGQLLSLFGLIVSATIALSSTTLVGNAMAGIMLRTIRSYSPGDYVHVGDHFGRISEVDLLHTEIQTEERDLTTLPNIYMVTHPVRVLRNSGTILSVEVSLGYDVPRPTIEKLLIQAATDTGLESPFVQIRGLGDYSISYAIAGMLTEVKNLLQKRRELRARTIDALHTAGVEIASPAVLSVRQFPQQHAFIPPQTDTADAQPETETEKATSPDSLIFDKAYEAESLEKQRQRLEELNDALVTAESACKSETDEARLAAAQATRDRLIKRIATMKARIENQETKPVD